MSGREARHCVRCGAELTTKHDGERDRKVCPTCGWTAYGNPTPVVAALVETPAGVILARGRGWPPKMYGLITGFLEAGETPEAGVLRELDEELGLRGEIVSLIGVYAFEMRNELIVAFHVRANGEPVMGEELEELKVVSPDKLRGWELGTGLAVRDWVARRAAGLATDRAVAPSPRGDEPGSLEALVTVDDFEAAAKKKLTPMAYDYFRSGADEEHTLRRNREAFSRYAIDYRVLKDVSAPAVATSVLGVDVSTPILVAPTAYHRLATPEGEACTARAAERAGSMYVASTLATTSLEHVAEAASPSRMWFQLYVHKDWAFTLELVERAKRAGYAAIAVTADTPVLGRRVADVRNGFALPEGMEMSNLVERPGGKEGRMTGSELARYVAERHDAAFTMDVLERLVAACAPLPLVVKGVSRADDAREIVARGARAVWVSNHGGRQLDLARATIDALSDVVDAVGDRAEVYVDGGVRSGTHALIALARGARAVFVGRPVLWGLAVAGEEGALRVLSLLHEELVRAMQLAGCADLASLRDGVVRRCD